MVYSIIVTQQGRFVKAIFFPKTSKDQVDYLYRKALRQYPFGAGYLVEWNG